MITQILLTIATVYAMAAVITFVGFVRWEAPDSLYVRVVGSTVAGLFWWVVLLSVIDDYLSRRR